MFICQCDIDIVSSPTGKLCNNLLTYITFDIRILHYHVDYIMHILLCQKFYRYPLM